MVGIVPFESLVKPLSFVSHLHRIHPITLGVSERQELMRTSRYNQIPPLRCIPLFVLFSALMSVSLHVSPCKLESRLNVFVFIPTVAKFFNYREYFCLNPAAFFEECRFLVVVNTSETQAAKKAIKKEIEHRSV